MTNKLGRQYMDGHVRLRLEAFRISTDLSHYEVIVLHELGNLCHMPPERLDRRTVQQQSRLLPKITESHAALARVELCERRFLQVIDDAALAGIEAYLARFPSVERPILPLPKIGDIDLTLMGASLYLRMEGDVYKREWHKQGGGVRQDSSSLNTIISTTQEGAAWLYFINFFRQNIKVSVGDLQDVGRWRSRWWKVYPSGWKLTVNILGG